MGEFREDPDFIARFRRLEERVAALAAPLSATYARSDAKFTTLTTGVETTVTLGSNFSATYNMAVAGTRITVALSGTYLVTSNVRFAANATGYRGVRVLRNGTYTVAGQSQSAVSGAPTRVSATGSFYLNAGDYLELLCVQTSGGNLVIEEDTASSEDFKCLNVFFVSP